MKGRLSMTMLAAALGAVVLASPSQAQRHFAGAAVRGPSSMHFRGSRGFGHARAYGRRGYYRRTSYGFYRLFYPPDLSSDYYSEPVVSSPPAPQVVIVQSPAAAAPAPAASLPEPLVLELQGDHWVQITDSGRTQVDTESHGPAAEPASRSQSAVERPNEASKPARQIPPAVLVFRDGHQEQTRKYTIVGATLYTSADYWNGGSWIRKIPIAKLDVPATLRLNRQRGVKFNLPSGPGEVVVRP